MIRYWTSDLHFGHANIIEYCKRPFKDIDHMNARLIGEANMRVKPEDTCIHLGDFGMKCGGVSRYFDKLQGTWVLVRGNHDRNNKVKAVIRNGFANVGKYHVFFSHEPYYYTTQEGQGTTKLDPMLIEYIEKRCDFALCGHVHEKWKVSRDGKILTINVGTDVWSYRPVSDNELIGLYEKERKL